MNIFSALKILICLSFSLFFTSLFSQNNSFEISGQLITENKSETLESATIYLETIKDSTLISYTISDKNGNFILFAKTLEKEGNLFVSYVGYSTYKQKILFTDNKIQLPPIQLIPIENSLDAIVIKSRAPITIKKDTLEFNAASFKTKVGATVEDLLKELPGVVVESDGTITVNGKPVNKLLVNGKPFFGDDPTIATRNLTKEMIEKVQVTDTKTDAEAFAGEEGDQKNKTINLTVSEEKNKGTFGRLTAGGGSDDRFEYAGIVNRFDKERRFSVLVGGNNTNSPGFSFGEIQKMFGGGNSMMVSSTGAFQIDDKSFGFGNGITNSRNAGATYADEYSKKLEIAADYFYSGADSNNKETIQRENIFPDTRFFTNSSTVNKEANDGHNLNLNLDIKIDSTLLLNIKPSFKYALLKGFRTREEQTLSETQELTNQSKSDYTNTSTSKTFKNAMDITKRFGNRGSSLRLSLNNEWNEIDGNDFLFSETLFFDTTTNDQIKNQQIDRNQTFQSFFTDVKYSIPIITKEVFIDFKYSLRNDTRKNARSTFDFNEETQEFAIFNTPLSTSYTFRNNRSTPGLGITIKKESYSFSASGGYVTRVLKNMDKLRPGLSTNQTFKALEYSSYINYSFSPQRSLYVNYSFYNSPPTLEQLQPFEDISDPLNTTIGNPELEPQNTNSVYFSYNGFDFQSGTGLNLYADFISVNNQITPVLFFDENLVRTTTYTNVNGNYSGYLGGNFNKSIKLDSIQTLKLNLGLNGNIVKSINFNGLEKFSSRYQRLSPRIGFTYVWKDVLEIKPRYGISYNLNQFDIALFKDETFFSHNVRLETATFLPKNLEWRNDINYNYNPNVSNDFQKSSWFWNTTLAYSLLKDQGIVTFKVYDLLKQNSNAQRVATQNYIQDTQSTVLQQYFMLSFSWKFNSLGKKGNTDSNNIFIFN